MKKLNKEEFFYTPNPVHVKDDFYAVKETGWTPVNKKGVVLKNHLLPNEVALEGFRHGKTSNGGTYRVITCNDGISRRVHRIVAYTFLPSKKNPKYLDVNHIDGNPGNNNLENLEWVNRTGNNLHVVELNLNSQNRWVLFKDLLTGEEAEIPSIQQTAKKLNCSGGQVAYYLQSTKREPFWGRYALCFKGDELPKYDVSKVSLFGRKVKDSGVIIAVPEDKDKRMVAYPNKKLLEASLGKEIEMEKVIDGVKYYYLADVLAFTEDKEDFYTNVLMRHDLVPTSKGNRTGSKPIPVNVTDKSTGETRIVESVHQLAKEWNMNYPALKKSIWRTKGDFRGYIITYTKVNKTGRRTEEN